MSKVYLSGPIVGQTYHEARFGWRQTFNTCLLPGHTVLSPMRHEGYLAELKDETIEMHNIPSNMFSHPKMIVAKDFLDIEACTIMVVHLIGAERVSQGTLVEIGYAKAKGKTIVVIKDDMDKIHTSPFISVCADVVCSSVEEAAVICNSLLSEGI